MTPIFLYEWKQLLRQPVQLASLTVFFLVAVYCMIQGKRIIAGQETAIAEIHNEYQQDFDKTLKKFSPDTSAAAQLDAEYARMPVMINYWLPQNAINRPSAFAFLSIGERDIQPYYQKIDTSTDYLDRSNVELENPMVLWAGNFDFAFVFIYLLPILVIATCYDVLSREMEVGTYRMLLVQRISPAKVTLYKLLFRFAVIGTLVLLLNAVALLPAPDLLPGEALLWLLTTLSYLLFWFSFCFAVISFQKDTLTNLVFLFSGWLLFVILLPACVNIYIDAKFPVPLRTSVASYKREVSSQIWTSEQAALVDTFLTNNPSYLVYYDASKVDDAAGWGNFEIAGYYDLLERKVRQFAHPFENELQHRRTVAAKVNRWNPVIRTQTLCNQIAQTSLEDHLQYEKQAERFQKQWRDFIYSYQLQGKEMSASDLKKFPVFQQDRSYFSSTRSLQGIGLICCWGLVLIVIGSIRFRTSAS